MKQERLNTKPIGRLLLEKGLITEGQLEQALEAQAAKGGLLGQVLLSLGYVTEKTIAQVLTVQYGYPYLPLDNYEFDKECVRLVPENAARQYGLVVIDKIGDMVTVAMWNPLNFQAVEDIELLTKCKVQIFVSTLTDIQKVIDSCYK
ncbi:MAG: hypothetical protein ABH885_01355 [Candidatus Omnitrophota bacterium]